MAKKLTVQNVTGAALAPKPLAALQSHHHMHQLSPHYSCMVITATHAVKFTVASCLVRLAPMGALQAPCLAAKMPSCCRTNRHFARVELHSGFLLGVPGALGYFAGVLPILATTTAVRWPSGAQDSTLSTACNLPASLARAGLAAATSSCK
jgi:hypothetical protein